MVAMLDAVRAWLAPMPEIGPVERTPRVRPPVSREVPTAVAPSWVGGSSFGGEKYPGGLSGRVYSLLDYWQLRDYSVDVFLSNLYGRGLIRRLVTNEIHVGLHLEATPIEGVLGAEPDSLLSWAEDVETRWLLWADDPAACDFAERLTLGEIQALIRREALVGGDVLVVMRQRAETRLPTIEVIDGREVCSSLAENVPAGHRVYDGVEVDAGGRQVAYHVRRRDRPGTTRIPAKDSAGRRVAWLVYGSDRLVGATRGEPLLSIVLQSLREIDRYRDSAQRKAVITSVLAMFIRKGQDKPGTLPLTGGATRRGTVGPDGYGDGNVEAREYRVADQIPGLVLEELQQGEEPVAFQSHGTDTNFPVFEAAVISAIAWSLQIPHEIATLGFSSNYSASQAALNEFKIYLDAARADFARQFLQPVYRDWLLSAVLIGDVLAPGLVDASRGVGGYAKLGAWTSADWTGAIKPTVDPLKQVKALELAVRAGLITRAYAARTYSGRKFARNVAQLAVENAQLAEANAPLVPVDDDPDTGGTPAVAPDDDDEENET